MVTEATPQLSDVTGVPRVDTVAIHVPASTFTVILDGQVITGFWLSSTVTVIPQVAVLPLMSVTVHCNVVVPTG